MKKNIIIIGAGDAGRMLAAEILEHNQKTDYTVLGFIDDNEEKKKVLGIPVLGRTNNISEVIKKLNSINKSVDEIIIAIPSAEQDTLTRIINIVSQTGVKHKIIPGLYEIIKGSFSLKDIRQIEPSDLLGREEIDFNEESIIDFYKDKTVLVTGGAGSIGSEIVRQLISLPIKQVIALDHNENSLNSLILSMKEIDTKVYNEDKDSCKKFHYVIANASDIQKVESVIDKYKPFVIFHAAAHKHLPLMESYPEEAVKNNILVTKSLAELAIKKNVKNFVFISTDKAVCPTSLMGASKRICERIILSLSKEADNTKFKITRFGNVLGSNGSVIPIFENQIRSGKAIGVTHPEMVRFFMSIREAARLVIKASTIDEAVIFALDMGKQVKILDLAKNMLTLYGLSEKDIPIVFTGIREGEKLYEEILMDNETLLPSKYKKLFSAEDKYKALTSEERVAMIKEFELAALKADKNEIKKLMKKYIEEYSGL